MDYDQFTDVDFLADETFQNYCAGEGVEDIAFWQHYIKANPNKHEEISTAKMMYARLNAHKLPLSVELDHFKQQFNNRVLSGPEQADVTQSEVYINKHGRLGKYKFALMGLAASICAFFVWTYYNKTETNKSGKQALALVFKTERAQRKKVVLDDGTSILLNADSKVSLRTGFNTKTRELDLVGEAYFDVHHNASVPFIVHTPKMDIRVLGTVFNVHAYQEDNKTEATLISGSIEATLNNKDHQKFILKPSEKISIANSERPIKAIHSSEKAADKVSIGSMVLTNKNVVVETAWVKNGLEINNETFSELQQKLEREYGVTLSFKDKEVMQYRFTATVKNEPITEVLRAMQTVNHFNYKVKDKNTIELSK